MREISLQTAIGQADLFFPKRKPESVGLTACKIGITRSVTITPIAPVRLAMRIRERVTARSPRGSSRRVALNQNSPAARAAGVLNNKVIIHSTADGFIRPVAVILGSIV